MEQREEQNHNEKQFEAVLAKIDPELARIRRYLKETRVDPVIIAGLINAIYEVSYMSGTGVVMVTIQKGKIINLEPRIKFEYGIKALIEETEDI